MTEDEFAAIKVRLASVPGPPWVAYSEEGPLHPPRAPGYVTHSVCRDTGLLDDADHVCLTCTVGRDEEKAARLAEFFANTRTDLDALVAEVERLRATVARLRGNVLDGVEMNDMQNERVALARRERDDARDQLAATALDAERAEALVAKLSPVAHFHAVRAGRPIPEWRVVVGNSRPMTVGEAREFRGRTGSAEDHAGLLAWLDELLPRKTET